MSPRRAPVAPLSSGVAASVPRSRPIERHSARALSSPDMRRRRHLRRVEATAQPIECHRNAGSVGRDVDGRGHRGSGDERRQKQRDNHGHRQPTERDLGAPGNRSRHRPVRCSRDAWDAHPDPPRTLLSAVTRGSGSPLALRSATGRPLGACASSPPAVLLGFYSNGRGKVNHRCLSNHGSKPFEVLWIRG